MGQTAANAGSALVLCSFFLLVLLIHPDDAAGLGIQNRDEVIVRSSTGEVQIEAEISDEAKHKILHHNAANMLSHLAPLAAYGQAAE